MYFLILTTSTVYSQKIETIYEYFQNKYQIFNVEDLERKKMKICNFALKIVPEGLKHRFDRLEL